MDNDTMTPEAMEWNVRGAKSQIVRMLKDVRSDAQDPATEGAIDVRLSLYPDAPRGGRLWRLWTGDVSYDTDHSGHCGASVVVWDATNEDLDAVFEDMLAEALESMGGV